MKMLGHPSATMTLDTYASLASAETERVTEKFNAHIRAISQKPNILC